MGKVLIFTRHTAKQFGKERLKLISKLYGKKVQIDFESIRFADKDNIRNIQNCINYFKEKIREGYYCYVVLPKYLKEVLLKEVTLFDPKLTNIIEEIETRVEIELAKLYLTK
jgi:hypothetical protein